MENARKILTAILLLITISTVQADDLVTIENATIDKSRLTNKWYGGGCLVFVSSYVGSKWCATNWVTFNCDGGKDSRQLRAYIMFNKAEAAMDRRNLVNVIINQSKIINGHCFVDDMVTHKEKAVE